MKKLLQLFTFLIASNVAWSQNTITITDDALVNTDQIWTRDNIYLLDGYVFLETGGTLTIEPGTVIKGKASPTTGDASSALIIAKGAQIIAEGTIVQPIIFTAEFDDINNPDDLTKEDKGLWGGLIILGKGIVGVDGGIQNVEGIPSTEGRAEYGGTNNNDNSGVLKYVSIRHGGSKLEANNEINGLTLGGVGSWTIIDYVEVFANLDDGIEFFGGAVNVKHAVVAFCGDDSFDFDQSWDGNGQFWFSLQDEESNRAGEWDGSESSDLLPRVTPTIANATFIGGGEFSNNEDNNDALRIKDDGAAKVFCSVFSGFAARAIVLDNDAEQDSYKRLVDGDIQFSQNIFFDFGAGSTFADIITTDGGDDNLLITQLTTLGNLTTDPLLGGISRIPDGGLDPRISWGPAFNMGCQNVPSEEGFMDNVNYAGAFGNVDNWADNWTALSANGFFGNLVSGTNDKSLSELDRGLIVYPNPVQNTATLSLELASPAELNFTLLDVVGRTVMTLGTHRLSAGKHDINVNMNQIPTGIFFALITDNTGRVVAKEMVIKK